MGTWNLISGNYAKFLKNLHSEQINKLCMKNQHECDLLEDIRTFTLKRSAIEKSYSEALLKISSAYLNKKIPNIPDIKLEGGEEKWNMWSVWRTVLEENEKLARARLAAVEVFQQQIADDAKVLRSHKVQMAKKVVDHLSLVHKELQACVQDVDKTKKLYFDEEHTAHDVRDKARDIEEKLKKKKGSFFQSITSLQKNSQKFSSKRDQLEEKSTGARNDYLLCLAAANAHQTRYFVTDLQLGMNAMESGVYDKVAEYLTLMGRTELLTCKAMENSFSTIRDQAKQLTREYNLQCCYLYYPVLKQHIQYDFEPCDMDPVDHITVDHDSAAATLSKEARRWATKIARENNNIKENIRKLQTYNAMREAGQKTDPNDPNGPDLETKIEEAKQCIRRAETAKVKAEARIEYLREGGVNVEDWLQEAESLNVQDIQRSASSLSVIEVYILDHWLKCTFCLLQDHPSSDSFYDSDFAEGEQVTAPIESVKQEKEPEELQQEQLESQEVDGEWAVLEQERQRIEQLTAGWDDPTQVDWGAEEEAMGKTEDFQLGSPPPSGPLLRCTALYSYTAQNPDELTIVENEQLEVVGEGDGDGWLRARNYRGEEGYVPHNYLDIEREQSATTPGLQAQISFSSVDYTIDNEEENQPQTETTQSPEQISVISMPIQKTMSGSDAPTSYCIALYDYDGEGGEELTFEEGQIIKVLSKCAHSIDDGWWQGELEGRIGNFPSLVVEECDEFGEPLTNQWDETPPQSAPPVFTPPDIPNFLKEPAEDFPEPPSSVEQPSQPAPVLNEETEIENDIIRKSPQSDANFNSFSIELTRTQHHQYDTQFEDDSNAVPTIGIPSLEISDENGKEIAQPNDKGGDDFSLGVAQIVITAATPMMEEPEQPFPPPEEDVVIVNHQNDVIEEETEEDFETEDDNERHVQIICSYDRRIDTIEDSPEAIIEEADDSEKKIDVALNRECDIEVEEVEEPEPTADSGSGQLVISSSTGSDGETTGPSTAENSVSQAPMPADSDPPKQVVGGRASIPDELEPHQLARLQDLKESNA
ncbi:protein nervous wreck-like isoform X3 [Dendroctonus ponderosae]|uniref:protein nervous wreck isoform X3 n=1 Tax=Dendroctonus ponderosae TaxID=77166 RepID=UPI002035C5A5|nr:protein nervous wreck isoform X3 [Dendroctonus ponderosae]XP_048523880.1 protein nervous wreck-like isoform X3 [Dendroctonus ponderosae]